MIIARNFVIFLGVGLCFFSTLILIFGVKFQIGSLETWLTEPTSTVIFYTAVLIFGAVSTITKYLFNLKKRPPVKELIILVFSTHLVTVLLLPACEYFCEDTRAENQALVNEARNYENKHPGIFVCHDLGYPSGCATTVPKHIQYVRLTNDLYRLAFIEGCVSKGSLAFFIPILIGLVAWFRDRFNKKLIRKALVGAS